jgi:hypothetical protein
VIGLEPATRVELVTCALRVRCSTTELRRLAAHLSLSTHRRPGQAAPGVLGRGYRDSTPQGIREKRNRAGGENFEAFTNAWASCLTRIDCDRSILDALMQWRGLHEVSGNVLVTDPQAAESGDAFRKWWPIFRSQRIRRLAPRAALR